MPRNVGTLIALSTDAQSHHDKREAGIVQYIV